eukprot:m.354347 g.354347  ORF g.354347 m.354347 type:complete len:501 (+) comp16986_c0_seq1:344-1846(+)
MEGRLSSAAFPRGVEQTLRRLADAIRDLEEDQIQRSYEYEMRSTTNKYFDKDEDWPAPRIVKGLHVTEEFEMLYTEYYYRHLFSKTKQQRTPRLQDRLLAYNNYVALFDYLLADVRDLKLCDQWVWDIVSEFVFQYQDYTLMCMNGSDLEESDIEQIKANPSAWDTDVVFAYLNKLVAVSQINEQLKAYRSGGDPNECAGLYASPLYKTLGYFSLVGLLRMNCLCGDYQQALHVMENTDLYTKGVAPRILACKITIHQYVGFCYLMLRRYRDAFQSLSTIALELELQESYIKSNSQKRHNIVSLLALVYALSPQPVDAHFMSHTMYQHKDAITQVQAGDESAMRTLFAKGCPSFVDPYARLKVSSSGTRADGVNAHCDVFLVEAKQQAAFSTIRAYLKLYHCVSLSKIASLLDVTKEDARKLLHAYKHKTMQYSWQGGTLVEGELDCTDTINFYIEGDEVHVANLTVSQNFGQEFLRENKKILDTVRRMRKRWKPYSSSS